MTWVREVTEEEMNSLTQSILTRYGIDFTCYEPKSLRRRIVRVMNLFNLASIHDLWVKFLHDSQFIQLFMNEVSVGMTSMFRDPTFWSSLKKRMLNELRHKPSINIWHAGCSTGEEVYSMGILLSEVGLQAKTKALATDINEVALNEAKSGIYHKIKMIENETNYRQVTSYRDFARYYTVVDHGHVKMNQELVSHVTFGYQNLITDRFGSGYDIIFCRNVMIYFDTAAKRKLLDRFYDALNPGGYFIIGFYDAVSSLVDENKFELVDGESRMFRKK
jgi:chemotaxis protein methyltransferase CheR